jgi:hypothetical protein
MATALEHEGAAPPAPPPRPFKNVLAKNEVRAAVENRVSVESLELLHYERRQAIEDLVKLELLFGSGGDRWEAIRARHRDGIAKLILTELETEWRKRAVPGAIAVGSFKEPAVEALKRMANSDPRHVNFCEEQEGKFAAFLHAKNKVQEIDDRIESRLAEMRYVTAEARLHQ